MTVWIILIIIIAVVLLFVSIYNSLVSLRNRVEDQWAQIEVQLKRRADLIPNLVEMVKGYAKHEKKTLEDVIAARNKFNAATTKEEEMQASGELTQVLNRLMVLSESYPELKADKNYLSLQSDLKETEDKIAFTRQFYNDRVLEYTNKIQMFPSSIVASMFKFQPAKFFEASEADKEVPKVKFD